MDRGCRNQRREGVTEPQSQSPTKKRLTLGSLARRALPFVGLALAIGFLVAFIDVRKAFDVLLAADPWWVGGAALLALNATVLVGLKLWSIVRLVELRRSFRETWSAVMAGLTLNAVLPGRGGELLRAVFLSREKGSFPILFGAVLVERLIDLGTLALLVLLTGIRADWITAIAASVLLGAVAGTGMLAILGPRFPIRPDLGERVARTAKFAAKRWPWTLMATTLSLLAWMNNAALMLCAMRAVGISIPTLEAIRATAVAILAGVVPITISGVGTRDAALVMLLQDTASPENLVASGLIYTALVYWFLAGLGALSLGPQTLRAAQSMAQSRANEGDPRA